MEHPSRSPSLGAPPASSEFDQIHTSPPALSAPGPTTLSDRKIPGSILRSTGSQQTYDNPLLTFDDTRKDLETGRTSLEEYVFDFAGKASLRDRYEVLIFGARLARDKHEALSRYDNEITDLEKALLQDENEKTAGFWKQSKFFRATIMTASLGGMIQGWTQSVNNGTIYGMPEDLGLQITKPSKTPDLWVFGMLNAIPLLSAGLFGTTLADPLQEYYLGRRGSIMVSAAITIATTIGASVTHTVGQLAACRAINGIALGAKASIVPIYSAEISPEHIRGAILANWQLADAAGIFLGFMANLIIVYYVGNKHRAWRILTNTVLVPTVPLMVMIYLMPESPRYLMKHGFYRRALDAFTMIQTTPLLASRDFMYAHAQLDFESRLMKGAEVDERAKLADRVERSEVNLANSSAVSPAHSIRGAGVPTLLQLRHPLEPRDSHQQSSTESHGRERQIELSRIRDDASDTSSSDLELALRQYRQGRKQENPYEYHIGVTGYFKRLVQLWSNMRCRRALRAASIAMITQQMTGINTIALLGTSVWVEKPSTPKDYKIAAAIGVCFGAANYLGGLPAYWLSDKFGRSIMLAAGLPNMAWSMLVFALLFKIPEDSSARIPLVSIFAVIFSDILCTNSRNGPFLHQCRSLPFSLARSRHVCVAVNLLGAGLLALVFPFLMDSIGKTGALSIFAGLNLVAFFLVYLFVPETRRRTLEELQFTFDLRTKWHVEYRAVYIRKHFVKNFWQYATGKPVKPPIPFYRWARITHGGEEERS
ncbi:major facilitator superfamily domain-containing protein [Lophiotrema nucula]|uniref:Major facilitator superfamily domain-containing protein n=1 Tax=Lophiotrema nucula TaxID=690887 RepID=A0A6A5YJE7_9PLEO|nr:major facilitator superfamily domain-containing protein [Lophiotrema nucula]